LLKIQQKSIKEDEKNLEKSENINFNRKKRRFHKTNFCKSRKVDEEDDTATAITISSAVVCSSVCGGFNHGTRWRVKYECLWFFRSVCGGFPFCRFDFGSGRYIF
jgi:hypothetical protein